MLMELLKKVNSEKISTVKELSCYFGQEPSLILAQLEILEDMGYLKFKALTENCERCPLRTKCKLKAKIF